MIDWFELRCIQIVDTSSISVDLGCRSHSCQCFCLAVLLQCSLNEDAKFQSSQLHCFFACVWHDVPTLWQTFSLLTTTVGLPYTRPKILYGTLTKIRARVVFVVEWLVGWFLFLLFSQSALVIIWSTAPPHRGHQMCGFKTSPGGMLGQWWSFPQQWIWCKCSPVVLGQYINILTMKQLLNTLLKCL